MASTISAGTTSATALNMTADTSGVLQLIVNNSTVALNIATSGAASFQSTIAGNGGVIGLTTLSGGFGLRAAADSTDTYAGIQFTNYAQNTPLSYIRSYASNKLSILDSAASSSVTVGIGTATPDASYSLDTTGTVRSRADVYAGFLNGSSGGVWLARNSYNQPAIQSVTSAGNAGILMINPAGGAVLIGPQSANGNVRQINLNANEIAIAQATTSVFLNLCDNAGNNGNTYSLTIRGLGSAGAAQNTLASVNVTATTVYNGSNTSTWNTTSDQRIKKNIVDNNEGLENILKVRVRSFEYRTPDEIVDFPSEVAILKEGVQKGVIAQEYQQSFPNRVHANKDGVLGLNTDETIWDLVNAVKTLTARIETLENK